MRKIFVLFCLSIFTISLFAQNNVLQERLEKRQELDSRRDGYYFKIFDEDLTEDEKNALEFLYAYMPLSDFADYSPEFYYYSVKATLEAKDSLSWGADIPQNIWNHFVLPLRVNNEHLDNSRMEFYRILRNRVEDLSMYEAALEVNHWCHEKVKYEPTDIRTSSPMATVLTAYGRCGEESTFTVAAMRAVGIPARQVYTPRWAHCDDNHAWVEVWIDGKWHFLGACEPTPELDMGWFASPATRAMQVNTNVFGYYNGDEEILKQTQYYTRINQLENYAAVKQNTIKVIDKDSNYLEGIKVSFGLYNYAEFYPLAVKKTDELGEVSLQSGYGDILVWVSDGENFAFKLVDRYNTEDVVIELSKTSTDNSIVEFTINPPVEGEVVEADQSRAAENDKRLLYEDSIRDAYVATFPDEMDVARMADSLGLGEGQFFATLYYDLFEKSRGNWNTLLMYFRIAELNDIKYSSLMLGHLTDKDLRDFDVSTIMSHLNYLQDVSIDTRNPLVGDVISPRIHNEALNKWREDVAKYMLTFNMDPAELSQNPRPAEVLIQWIYDSIEIDNEENYYNVPISAKGVLDLKVADKHSRDQLFVAMCRTIFIPAKIDPVTLKPQYLFNGKWVNVSFEEEHVILSIPAKAKLNINYDQNIIESPEYYTHFTIQKYEDGFYKTLDYENSDEFNMFPADVYLDEGKYLIVTGNRMSDGSVKTRMEFFELRPNMDTTIQLVFSEKTEFDSLATINTSFKYDKYCDGLELGNAKNGYVMLVIDPQSEPGTHFLIDYNSYTSKFSELEIPFVFIVESETDKEILENKIKVNSNIKIIVDKKAKFKSILSNYTDFDITDTRPIIWGVYPDTDIFYYSNGYKIGSCEQLLKGFLMLQAQ